MLLKEFFVKLIYIINIPGHIKRLYIRRKLKKRKNTGDDNNSELFSFLINILLILIIFSGLIYLNYVYQHKYIHVGSILFTVIFIFILVGLHRKKRKKKKHQIEKIILKDENGDNIREWNMDGLVSIVIGKKTKNNNVDIDLSQVVYSSLISRQHAVMNKADNKWYFEDMNSFNGSGILRHNSEEKFKVESGKAYRIYSGDILFIANTKLLLK